MTICQYTDNYFIKSLISEEKKMIEVCIFLHFD